MGVPLPRPAALAARLEIPVEEWPYLDEEVLLKSRSRKVCMTCHWSRHHAGVNCIPLILTSQEDPLWVQRIWDAGARGYLHKELALAQVELALASLLAGASWWDQKATAALQHSDPLQATTTTDQNERLNDLTQRERQVLACLAAGDNNRAIAQQLGIGEGTVRSHVHVLLQKLQVSNRTQAALIWAGR